MRSLVRGNEERAEWVLWKNILIKFTKYALKKSYLYLSIKSQNFSLLFFSANLPSPVAVRPVRFGFGGGLLRPSL